MKEIIGSRLQFARKRAKLTQADVARRLGFKDRQTLTAIEAGQRKLTAEELVRATKVLGVDLDFLTNPLRLVGEGAFTWTVQRRTTKARLDDLEERTGGWVALYRTLGAVLPGTRPKTLEAQLPLSDRGSLEEVQRAAEALGREWKLKDTPALLLPAAIEQKLNYLILMLDFNTETRMSSGACRLPLCNAIFLNRSSDSAVRSIGLATHCFHLLTWSQLAPARCVIGQEQPQGNGQEKRIARLAKRFAEALLIPQAPLKARWSKGAKSIEDFLGQEAAHFRVTEAAVASRLVALGLITSKELPVLKTTELPALSCAHSVTLPPIFNHPFIERVHAGISRGHIGARRAADILRVDAQGLAERFIAAKLQVPFVV